MELQRLLYYSQCIDNRYKLKMQTPPTMETLPETVSDKHNQQQLSRHTLDVNNLFNKLISFNYNAQFSNQHSLEADVGKLFDQFIWSEKHNPALLYDLFDMQVLEQVTQAHSKSHIHFLMKTHIILMTNSSEKGILAELLLDNKLPSKVLKLYLQNTDKDEEIIEYVGSFLKMYHRLFHPDWLKKFIHQQNYFQLLQLSFKFYNCPQLITRTSVFNIIFSLLEHQQVRQFLFCIVNEDSDQPEKRDRQIFYKYIIDQLTKQLCSELTSFCLRLSHTSKNDDVKYIMAELEDKIAFWQDISKSMKQCVILFHKSFIKNVLLPLLIGPLQFQQQPLFTLKFSLYVIKKLIPTIHELELIQILVSLMFIQEQVAYWPSTLQKGVMYPFKAYQLLNKSIPQLQEEQDQQAEQSIKIGPKLKNFYLSIFHSKDNHFLLMISALMCSIVEVLHHNYGLQVVKRLQLDPKSLYSYSYDRKLLFNINQILISQLQEPHRLTTIISILDTLIYINTRKPLQENMLQNQYIYIMKRVIKQNRDILKHKNQPWDLLIQALEYDLRYVDSLKFGALKNQQKYEEMYKIVFSWSVQEQEKQNEKFYSSVIDNNEEQARYIFIKFMLMYKACQFLFDGIKLNPLKAEYLTKIISKSPYIQADVYHFSQLKAQAIQCELLEKDKIPLLYIKDQNFFVIAHLNKLQRQVIIMAAIKYKFIEIVSQIKKEKLYLTIKVKAYNAKIQKIYEKQPIRIKISHNNNILPYLLAVCRVSREKQLSFMTNLLRMAEQRLSNAQISLI